MKAAVYRRFGGPEVVEIQDVVRPVPAADEILIRVRATTVSAADYRSRSRDVPAGLLIPSSLVLGIFRPRRPVLGMDAAGVVVEVGEHVERFAPGRRGAGHARKPLRRTRRVRHPEVDRCHRLKPRSMSFDDAASLIFGGITARAYLEQVAIGAGTTVLVNGASGAVGTAVVQLAKAAGAHVTGVSSKANAALVASLGADRTIDYASTDFAAGRLHLRRDRRLRRQRPGHAGSRQPESRWRRAARGRRPPLDHLGEGPGPPTRDHRDHRARTVPLRGPGGRRPSSPTAAPSCRPSTARSRSTRSPPPTASSTAAASAAASSSPSIPLPLTRNPIPSASLNRKREPPWN